MKYKYISMLSIMCVQCASYTIKSVYMSVVVNFFSGFIKIFSSEKIKINKMKQYKYSCPRAIQFYEAMKKIFKHICRHARLVLLEERYMCIIL